MDDQNLLPPQAAASSVGESAPTTTPQPNGAEVPTASAHRSVVGTQPPSLSGSDTGIPGDRDRVEPRPPVDVESRTRKQKSPKRHKKRRLPVVERDRDVTPAESIDFVDSSTVATASSGIIHQKAPEDKEHSPTSDGPENEAHCVDSQNVGSCESDQPSLTSQSSPGDWADDMKVDDAQQTSIPPPESMTDIEPVFAVQHVDVCMFTNGKFKNVVAMQNSGTECPLAPGGKLLRTYALRPAKSATKNWIALEDSFNRPGASLASTVVAAPSVPDDRNVFAIYVSYYVKVKLLLGAMGGELALKLPFMLVHPSSESRAAAAAAAADSSGEVEVEQPAGAEGGASSSKREEDLIEHCGADPS
ncbi:uncharacterized protein LOC126249516 [Schistocerca nitens]|uniref:uncharacterized protein LOC126249516 n=1 Tax=Schistocerca nitens TaxID=7011 RepID=UPI002117DE92|nr:uncharacterized protein LOC126249516 [Schistocerca nitens]